MRTKPQSGFTLPELLVALLIFSLVATAAVFALRLGVNAREQLTRASGTLADWQAARIIIKEDLAGMVVRPVRDEFGSPAGPPFRGGMEAYERNAPRGETRLAAFVRAGWSNPGGDAPRSNLQHVEYLYRDGALVRRIRPFIDDARGQKRFERALLRDIGDVEMNFLTGEVRGELDWAAAWPLPQLRQPFPMALSIAVRSGRFGEVEQLFWIGPLAVEGGRK